MSYQIKDIMSRNTNEQLVRIIYVEREKYGDAVAGAAEEEMKARGLNAAEIEELKLNLANKAEEHDASERLKVDRTTRLLHYIIDKLVIYITTAVIWILVIWAFIFSGTFREGSNMFPQLILVYLLSFFGYYVFMEARFQKTLGKMIAKTKVVTLDTNKPSLKNIMIRTCCRLIPFNNIALLMSRSGFHDALSGTMVIHDETNLLKAGEEKEEEKSA